MPHLIARNVNDGINAAPHCPDMNDKINAAPHCPECERWNKCRTSLPGRVSDPHWFNADPDSGSGSRIRIPDPDPGFDGLKWKKNLQLEIYFTFFWSKIAIYLSLGLHKGRPSCRRNLQHSKGNIQMIQHFKRWKFSPFFYFLGSLLPSWIRIRIRNLYADPDPDPAAQINADPCGSGSGYGSGSETLLPGMWMME